MSSKINSSRNDVKNSEVVKIEEVLNITDADEQKSFVKFCKQVSEVNFKSKNLQIYDGSNKLDEMNLEYCELTSAIKLTNHSLNEHLISAGFENFNEKLQIQNAVLFYQLGSKFNLSDLQITVIRYIERCFSMIVETESFLELDLNTVSKILASSSLQIDSEVEIYNAASKWLNYNIEERSKFAKKLLLKVRLNLLSDQCLKYLIHEYSCNSKNVDFLKFLKNKDSFYQNKSTIHNKSRHCNQNMFNILICGGYEGLVDKSLKQVNKFDVKKFKEHMELPSMLEDRHLFKVVYLKGEVYVFGGIGSEQNCIKSVEKYSPVRNTWNKVTNIPDERQDFCACSFMNEIYFFGGSNYGSGYLNSCLEFDAKALKWKEVAKMNETRSYASCEIFEGNIVVSGGIDTNLNRLNTVESYDVYGDTWTPMPNMNGTRSCHSLVCVKSKLFAIGGANINTNFEVFDKTSKMFVKLDEPKFFPYSVESVSVGSKIFMFQSCKKSLLSYDVDKDEWSKESCKATENISHYSTIKVPLF